MMRRKRKRTVKFATIATQTEDVPHQVNKNLVVNMTRLKESELLKMLSKDKALRRPCVNTRQSLSRLPSNYSHFVRPINNHEVANSTVVNLTESVSSGDATRRIKPGPKSYKAKMFRKLQSLRAPVALAEPVLAEEKLTTVAEGTSLFTTPGLQEVVSVDVHEVPLRTVEAQTEDDGLLPEDGNRTVELDVFAEDGESVPNRGFVHQVSNKCKQKGTYIKVNARKVKILIHRM